MTTPATITKTETTAPVKAEQTTRTYSESFLAKVERQIKAELGTEIAWTPLQRTLAQHLFVKMDSVLRSLEVKRVSNSSKKNDVPIIWKNVNMDKVSRDAVHLVAMELDALIPNHIHIVPYFNRRTGKYDVDLQIGYMGKDLVARKFSIHKPVDIRYQLVHEGDHFEVGRNESGGDLPIYKPFNLFNPGKVIGGYGYIVYEDPRMNRIVIVEYREFEKAQKASNSVEFWGGEQTAWEKGSLVNKGYDEKFLKEMQFKTVVRRTCSKIALDPCKINTTQLEMLADNRLDYVEASIENQATAALESDLESVVVEVDVDSDTDRVVDASTVDVQESDSVKGESNSSEGAPF